VVAILVLVGLLAAVGTAQQDNEMLPGLDPFSRSDQGPHNPNLLEDRDGLELQDSRGQDRAQFLNIADARNSITAKKGWEDDERTEFESVLSVFCQFATFLMFVLYGRFGC